MSIIMLGWINRFDYIWFYYIRRKIFWINYFYLIFSISVNIEMVIDEMVIILFIIKLIYSVILKIVKKCGYLIYVVL